MLQDCKTFRFDCGDVYTNCIKYRIYFFNQKV
jgi:hypothetical protein